MIKFFTKLTGLIKRFQRLWWLPRAFENQTECFFIVIAKLAELYFWLPYCSVLSFNQIFIYKCFCRKRYTARKVSKYGDFSVPYFPVFGLSTGIYYVKLRIQSKYREIRTRRNPYFDHFLHSDRCRLMWKVFSRNILSSLL